MSGGDLGQEPSGLSKWSYGVLPPGSRMCLFMIFIQTNIQTAIFVRESGTAPGPRMPRAAAVAKSSHGRWPRDIGERRISVISLGDFRIG
jgi:hypothetical protein